MRMVSLATVKARLSGCVDDVEATHERVVITRNGTPAAVLLAPEDLESLEETVAILSDPEAMAELVKAREAMARGDLVPLDDVVTRDRGTDVPGMANANSPTGT